MPLTVLSVAFPFAPVSPGTAGGAEQILLTIDRALMGSGHRSMVVAAAGSESTGLLFPVQIPSGELNEKAKHEARRGFRHAINHVLANFNVDIVHMHGLDFHEYLPESGVPVVVTLHLPLDWYACRALCPRRSAHLICVSGSQAATAPAEVQIDAVIPNGVDLQEYSCARRKGNFALIMGRICPEKGIHLALDAAKSAGIPVIVAGSVFPYREHEAYFQREVQPRLSGSAPRYIGAVGRERKARLLAGAKCLLIASQAQETSSLVAMEALASGTPVIAWHSGALPEIVADGRTGYLVSSVEEMASAIRRIDSISPAECRREAQQRFCSERMIADYFSLYRRVAQARQIPELQAA